MTLDIERERKFWDELEERFQALLTDDRRRARDSRRELLEGTEEVCLGLS